MAPAAGTSSQKRRPAEASSAGRGYPKRRRPHVVDAGSSVVSSAEGRMGQAASAACALATSAANASGWVIARSDRTLRSTSMPALLRPSMKRE